jgi:3-deoxy-D-manno-octulosonic-acid transferase
VDVLVVNTTGELMNFYAACDIAYVGKSLAGNEGGHNIIEPAIFGKPIIHGANMQNFRAVATAFRQAQAAVEVEDVSGFAPALRRLLAEPAERQALGARARHVVEQGRGAIDRTLDLIEPLLDTP